MRLTEKYIREKENPHIRIHKIFYTNPKYKKLKSWDRELYAICRDKWSLSLRNNYINEKGEIFFFANQEELAKYIGISRKTVIESFKKLIQLELLEKEIVKTKGGTANRYYLCEVPELVTESYISLNHVTESDIPCNSKLQPHVTESDTNNNNIIILNNNIIYLFKSSEFKEKFDYFVQQRKLERKNEGNDLGILEIDLYQKRLYELSKGNEKEALKILEKAIMRNWKDFYIEEGKNGNSNNTKYSRKQEDRHSKKPDYTKGFDDWN